MIDSVAMTTAAMNHGLLSVSAAGIHLFRLETDSDGADFDILTFSTSVPEPSAFALLGGGAIGLMVFSRSGRKKS